MEKEEKHTLIRIIVALVIFFIVEACNIAGLFDVQAQESSSAGTAATTSQTLTAQNGLWLEFILFAIPYLIAGYDVLIGAFKGILKGKPFGEKMLMTIASLGAFALVFFPESEPHMAEGAAVMLFYQVGEFFQDYAVGKSRKSIAEMMDIAAEFANLQMPDGSIKQVNPKEVQKGAKIIIKPGERVPLDGIIEKGSSRLDSAAITGESVPRTVNVGDTVVSGCINLVGVLTVKTTGTYEQSTVCRILELVEKASERKAKSENFITRFARYYTPIVSTCALLLAVIPPLIIGASWSECVKSALVFLVVSCPCALVISVPLSFFSGIGAASRHGILIKGSSYIETLSQIKTVVFDKTGTLTNGSFEVVALHPSEQTNSEELLELAAFAEVFSDHPCAISIKQAYGKELDAAQVSDVQEISGQGVSAQVKACIGNNLQPSQQARLVQVGNATLMQSCGIAHEKPELAGTILHVAMDGKYFGYIIIADVIKEDAKEAIESLHKAGVKWTIMLTGDRQEVAASVAKELNIDVFKAQLLPENKVQAVEELLKTQENTNNKLAFVGDGINDAPVLMRADIGIAMGAFGSDAAIEAADVVLMDDKPTKIATALKLAAKTMRIVRENIIFAIGIKIAIMILSLPVFGIANMWVAVFGDVGVAFLCILNAMRAMRVQ